MNRALLISNPNFDGSRATSGANAAGIRLKHVRYWEQVTSLTVTENGVQDISFDWVSPDSYKIICIAAYPDFAVPPSDINVDEQFLRAEWIAALGSYAHAGQRPLINAHPICTSTGYSFSDQRLLPALAQYGWECWPRAERISSDNYHLLCGWNAFSAGPDGAIGSALPSALLLRSHELMTKYRLDFLVLRTSNCTGSPIGLAGAHVAPPAEMPAPLWEVFWNELSIF
jgi:hypothetical protein